MGETPTEPETRVPRVVLALSLLLGTVCAAATVATLTGVGSRAAGGTGGQVGIGLIHGGGFLLAAAIASLRALQPRSDRRFWSLVAGAVVLRTFSFLWYVVAVDRPLDQASLADVTSLLSGLLLAAALVLLVRQRMPRNSPTLLLDALIAGAATASVSFTLLSGTLGRLSAAGDPWSIVATNLAHPMLDVALLVVVVALLVGERGHLSRGLVVLCAGVSVIIVADSVFFFEGSLGTFPPARLLMSASLIGTTVVSAAGWLAPRTTSRRPVEREAGLWVPVLLAATCVGVLLHSGSYDRVVLAPLLAALGVALAILRAYLTVRVDRREASATLDAKQRDLERFRAMVEASGDYMGMADTAGRLIYLNPAGRRLVGLAEDHDVTAMTVSDFLPPEGQDDWAHLRRPAALGGGRWEGESWLRDFAGGPPIPVTTSTFAIRDADTGEVQMMATVQRDISARNRAERELRDLADQRQVLLGHLVQAQEDERARIAADVHDDSVQALAAVELRLALLLRDVADRPGLRSSLETVQGTVLGAMRRLRSLLFDLESPARDHDLSSALSEAAAYVLEDQVRWRVEGEGGEPLEVGARVTAYRIVKEALVNVRKHADAHRVVLELHDRDDGLEVSVTDDGRGFDVQQVEDRPGHLGLVGMRERATVAGGRLDVRSRPGEGTTVRLWLPGHVPGPGAAASGSATGDETP